MQKAAYNEFVLSDTLGSSAAVLRGIFFSPRRFFLGFEAEGPVKDSVFFVLGVSAVSAVLRLALVFLFSTGSGAEAGVSALEALAFVALSPVVVAVLSGAYLLSVRTFIGPVGTFAEVYRMLAHAYGAMILFWVPIVQAFAFTYATLVLMLFAIRSVYRTTFLTAVVTALFGYVPASLFFVFLQVQVTGLAF